MTAAGARDAHRSNAGQKASALAESGINNALAVLNANYPGVIDLPGRLDSASHADDDLPDRKRDVVGNARERADQPRRLEVAVAAHRARQRQESDRAHRGGRRQDERPPSCRSSSRTARPCLRARRPPTGSTGSTTSPSASPSTSPRRSTPVTTSSSRTPRRSPRRSRRRSPCPRVRTGSRPGTTSRSRARRTRSATSTARPIPANDLAEIHVANLCSVEEQPDPPRLRLGGHRQDLGRHPRQRHPARLPHDSDAHLLQPHRLGGARRRRVAPGDPAEPELHGLLVPQRRPRPEDAVRHLQRHAAEVRHRERDARQHDQPERLLARQPVRPHRRLLQLHVGGRPDQARVGRDEPTLTIKGTVFIDGSAKSTSGNAKYVGKGTIILSGRYSMDNNTQLCVNSDCGVRQSACALGRRHHRPRDRRRRDRPLDRRQHRHQEGKLPGAAPRQREHRRERLGDTSSSARWSASTGASTPDRAARSSSRRSPSRRRARTD